MKINALLLVFGLTLSITVNAQLKVSHLKDECHTENVFPYIEPTANSKVAEKINIFLQVDLLGIVPGAYTKCAFEQVMYDTSHCCSSVSFYEYTITKNSQTIFSVSMDGETMAAYPENRTWTYNFNAVNGDLISPEDIFTESAYAKLKKQITANRLKEVEDFLAGLKTNPESKDPDEIEFENDQRQVYESCLEFITEEDFVHGSFLIENDKIIFIRERCSNHAMRAVDDLDKFYNEFLVKDIFNDLNAYGKALFSENTTALKTMAPSIRYNKLLKGTLNSKTPITCLFKTPYSDGSLSMVYWYDNHKTIIEWSGKLDGNRLELVENDHHDEKLRKWIPRALIEAAINQNIITGVWKDQKNGRSLPLKLIKY